jgi:hypothetical protein
MLPTISILETYGLILLIRPLASFLPISAASIALILALLGNKEPHHKLGW